jgi:hypothetical protein
MKSLIMSKNKQTGVSSFGLIAVDDVFAFSNEAMEPSIANLFLGAEFNESVVIGR